jgi:hypothetical protein
MNQPLKALLVGTMLLGGWGFLMWLGAENETKTRDITAVAEEAAPPPQPMPSDARAVLENLSLAEAQSIINSVGKSCPMVTAGAMKRMSNGDPAPVVACSDGERYLIFWDGDDAHLDALSCSWGVC